MSGPVNPFPLDIPTKIDSWGKLALLQYIDPSLKLTADEINKMVQALEYLNNNIVTGGYTGNVPLKIKPVIVDHGAAGTTAEKVKNALNAGANYPLADGYTQWLYTNRMVLTNGTGISSTPGGPQYAVITEYFYLRKKIPLSGGVASLGVGGTEIAVSDLVPLPPIDTRNFAPQEFALGNIGSNTIHGAVSLGTDRSTPNTATIVFTATQDGVEKAWLYEGEQENVGSSFPAVTAGDFRLFPADGSGADPTPPTVTFEPKVTANTGTTINLGWIFGNECNMLSANSNSALTLTNIKPGGEATVLINRATEPTVTGATKIAGHAFQASTDMHLKVKCRQSGIVQYYFLKLT